MDKTDSLKIGSEEVLLTLATCHQIDELLEFYSKNPSNSNKARYSLQALIEDLINQELPKLMVEHPKARKIILNKMSEVAEF